MAPVNLLVIGNRQIELADFECTCDQAVCFAQTFRDTLDRLPESAASALLEYWARWPDSPRVSLRASPRSWGGRGWAASTDNGRSIYVAASIAIGIPEEYLQTYIAHECGHALCIAVDEPTHSLGPSIRAEWLNWLLMEAWEFDQEAAELWTYRWVDESHEVPVIRNEPLDEAVQQQRLRDQRQRLLERLQDKSIPRELRPWIEERGGSG
jgi:hypothetical protein